MSSVAVKNISTDLIQSREREREGTPNKLDSRLTEVFITLSTSHLAQLSNAYKMNRTIIGLCTKPWLTQRNQESSFYTDAIFRYERWTMCPAFTITIERRDSQVYPD